MHQFWRVAVIWLTIGGAARAEQTLLDKPVPLRSGAKREWSSFPEQAAPSWQLRFDSDFSGREATLQLRQEDVKALWKVSLNGKEVGRLIRDENPMRIHFPLPPGSLKPADNLLEIAAATEKNSDDVRVGPIVVLGEARDEHLRQSTLEVVVRDGEDRPLPCRLTITDLAGTLAETGAVSDKTLAVRPGTVYSLSGEAELPLPSGDYLVYAGRGFEYSLDKRQVTAAAGQRQPLRLTLRREVPTAGYVACDTHVHSRTHSGHGDATVEERMITLAGEGIELPIATDHNVNIDHRPFARALGADRYFTPVIGNEVTTAWGHFNVFPVDKQAPAPDHRGQQWHTIFDAIEATPGVKAVILNHARDLHSNYRPFGPRAFNDAAGENVEGWKLRSHAMEVINSGATQTDPLRLFHDSMALLNSGLPTTPVGCSDSHDVARHFVGQGRTYIRCDDRDVSAIDVAAACENFVAGRVRVSYGLLVELIVEDRWTCGEVARVAAQDDVNVRASVLGPHWTSADTIRLYANGTPVRTESISRTSASPGVLWEAEWKLPRPRHDVHWVAIASGPGIEPAYWRTAKPYQPDSPDPATRVLGCSGAVWLDVDGDGRASSARDYAMTSLAAARGDLADTIRRLGDYDEPTAAQAAWLLHRSGLGPLDDTLLDAVAEGKPAVRAGFLGYREAWRRSELARAAR